MRVLVLYQSRGGNTRKAAESVAKAAQDMGHTVTIRSVIEVQKSDIENADALFVGTWIQGFILFGVKPAGATLWVPALPSLQGKPVGIFCTYAFNPRGSLQALGDLLTAKGAHIIGQRAFHRSGLGEGAAAYVKSVLESVVLA